MESIKKFNELNGRVVSRVELQALVLLAETENQPDIIKRINNLLDKNPKAGDFDITLNEKLIVPSLSGIDNKFADRFTEKMELEPFLAGIDFMEADPSSEAMGAALKSEDIYNLITNKIIETLSEPVQWKKQWQSDKEGFLIAYSYDSKKPYKGANAVLLGSMFLYNPKFPLLQNPYYLTPKQVEKKNGKVMPRAQLHTVIFHTIMFKYTQAEPPLEFNTFDQKKFMQWTIRNMAKITALAGIKTQSGLSKEAIALQFAQEQKRPILRYHEVYNGSDIKGIDFDLENFKGRGQIKKLDNKKNEKLAIPEAIIANYPKPSPTLKFGGNRAFFRPSADLVQMPRINQFNFTQAYYTTFFHELVHSTGSPKRLDRVLGKVFGSKEYAFEELIAELGASFLSAEAGILHFTFRNGVAYIKGWRKSLLKEVKEDNKLLFRAASQAQRAVDFMLQRDKVGKPKYLRDIEATEKPKTKPATKTATKTKPKKPTKKPTKKRRKTVKQLGTAIVDISPTNGAGNEQSGAIVGLAPIAVYQESQPTKKKAPVIKKAPAIEESNGDPKIADPNNADPNKNFDELKKMGFDIADEAPKEVDNIFYLPNDLGLFLQKIQAFKALILIKGTKHTSKSQLAMQIANGFAELGKEVVYIDGEQGGMASKDTIDSVNRNASRKGRKLIAIKGSLDDAFTELKTYCQHCKAVVVDSVTDVGLTADQLNQLRKEHPQIIWVFISQVKENGEMYGGNKMAHNPTVVIECHPSEAPQNRYATLEKNRGNDLSLCYNIFHQKLIADPKKETENMVLEL